ncbi:MAG: hypothetical protein ACC656_12870, partial [Candidatus Heimdallarchaeota archaeon]
MFVLDNSVLSAYIRLNLLSELHTLKTEIYITPEIVSEYSVKWIEKLPDWVLIKKTKYNILKGISNLSESDHSVINLSIELNCQ